MALTKETDRFRITLNPADDTAFIVGLKAGWKATYTREELPSKIAFYERLMVKPSAGKEGRELYRQCRDLLAWAKRMLDE